MNKNKVIKTVNKYVKKGQIDKAVAEWEKFLKDNEGDGNIYNTIGDLYLKKNKKDNAIESFKRAAEYFQSDGFTMKAMALYKKALNIKPDEVDSIVALADMNLEKGLKNNATDNYLRAIELCRNNGETEKVIELIEKVLSFDPDNSAMRMKIADIYAASDMKKHAADEYCKIALLLKDQGDKKGVHQYYKKALETNESCLNALQGLSVLEEEAHNIKSALLFLKKALKIYHSDNESPLEAPPELSLKFVKLSLKIDDTKNAKRVLQNFLKSDPSHEEGKKLLGKIHIKEGLLDEAWKELAAFIDDHIEEKEWHEALELLEPFKEAKPIDAGSRLVLIYKNTNEKQAQISQLWALVQAYEKSKLTREALQSYHEISMLAPDDKKCKEKIQKLNEKLIDEIDEFEEAVQETPAFEEETSVTKALDDSLKRVEILLSYELYKDAKDILEQMRDNHPDNNEIEAKYHEVLSMIKGEEKDLPAPEAVAQEIEPGQEESLVPQDFGDEDTGLQETIEQDQTSITERVFPEGVNKEAYEENLYEADFYAQQGLKEEAITIYKKLLSMTPDNDEIIQKLDAVSSKEGVFFNPVDEMPVIVGGEETTSFSLIEEIEEKVETREIQMDKAVMDVFQQFKETVDKEVSVEDYDTHYELGIAYREMGMLDDALHEFRYNGNEVDKMIKSTIMVSQCLIDKELYEEALQEYVKIMNQVPEDSELYLELQYSISELLEKTGQSEKAVAGYKIILQKNALFKDVSEKIDTFEKAGI